MSLPLDLITLRAPALLGSFLSNIPMSSILTPCPLTMVLSWMQPGTSPTMRLMREIGVLEMELQDYEEGNITDAFLHIYSRLLSLIYLHLNLHQSIC